MKPIILILPLIIIFQSLIAQSSSNMTLQGTWNGSTSACVFGGAVCYNEVWGYVDGSGNEYAIICSPEEVHFIDVTNPASPTLEQSFMGTGRSIWRDVKSYGNYVYVIHDTNYTSNNEGLWIFDMSALPSGNIVNLGTLETHFGRAHNIVIDEANARLYVAGSDTQNQGLIIYDISIPNAPTLLASVNLSSWGGYVHDLYVRDHIAYCNSGGNGMWIYDFTNSSSPVAIDNVDPGGYNHSSWLTDDGNHIVYAIETQGKPLYIADVSDLTNNGIVDVENFMNPLTAAPGGNTAHNPLILGDYLFVSYYEDGVQVWDISTPSTPTLAGYYDMIANATYNGTDRGVWGVYPFLPSGNILASDDLTGLYVLRTSFPLPVELTKFTAKVNDNYDVVLDWETATEENNKEFVVERSLDGINFETVTTVRGNGNSSEPIQYQAIDYHPYSGESLYRLKQIDFNGEYEYSKLKSVKINNKGAIVLSPNPTHFNSSINIHWNIEDSNEKDIIINIYDISGKKINSENIMLTRNYGNFNINYLNSGVYIIELQYNNIVKREKLIISDLK